MLSPRFIAASCPSQGAKRVRDAYSAWVSPSVQLSSLSCGSVGDDWLAYHNRVRVEAVEVLSPAKLQD